MAKRKSNKRKVQATASAKAEVVAKATYQRKHTITEVIPPDVTRAKTSAWLDLVSPLTEWAGLRGDELRLRRAQLRLQREDVLAEIVRRAQISLKKSSAQLQPIQNKFLVPFLEKASLEDENSPLIDMWAGLLVSAAEGGTSEHVHFVSIISQLSQKQGELFARFVYTKSSRVLELAMDNIRDLEFHAVRETIGEALEQELNSDRADLEILADIISERMNCIGVEVIYGDVGFVGNFNYVEIDFVDDDLHSDPLEVNSSILEAVGLIRRVEVRFTLRESCSISLVYHHLTNMGFHFAKACGLVRDLGNIVSVAFQNDVMLVTFKEGQTVNVPLEQFPNLLKASSSEREEFNVTYISVEWRKLGEEIRIDSFLELVP